MNLRPIGTYLIGGVMVTSVTLKSNARRAPSNSAVLVMAEMTQGRLSSTTSQPGDVIALKLPFVVAVDQQTSSAIASRLGTSPSGPTYRIGRGLHNASGSQATLAIFSHLNNDTVITSAKKFEISSGAQMRLLVGVNRN
jgi:hypothetical protein